MPNFIVRKAKKNKMSCFVILDVKRKELVKRFDSDLKKNVSHFWSKVEANDFAKYMSSVMG